jgi:hypothetical protein
MGISLETISAQASAVDLATTPYSRIECAYLALSVSYRSVFAGAQ